MKNYLTTPPTIREWRKLACDDLAQVPELTDIPVEVLYLEIDLLLTKQLNLSRTQIISRLDSHLLEHDQHKLQELLKRRKNAEPLAYILGTKEFYGIDFRVTPDVLIPRPETELLVDAVLKLCSGMPDRTNIYPPKNTAIVDIGTGSGAIPISIVATLLGRSGPQLFEHIKVYAIDVSDEALTIAESNAQLNGVNEHIHFIKGDLLTSFHPEPTPDHIIWISNPPYLSPSDNLSAEVRDHEPHLALFGGKSGNELTFTLVDQIAHLRDLNPKVTHDVLIEISEKRGQELVRYVKRHGFVDIALHNDLASLPRHITFRSR